MIRLLCIDVDGTLVGASGTVHPAVWPAAERARAAGLRLAICSGRPGFGITRAFAERLSPEGWHSFQNGASVVHLPSGRSRSVALPDDGLREVLARARALGRILELYSDVDYVVDSDDRRAREHAALLGVPFARRTLPELDGPVVRAQWLLTLAEREAIVAEPHPGLEVSPSESPVMPDTLFVSLTPSGVDKGSAVRMLAAEYGVPLEAVMYVGDGSNDVPALRIVGRPVVVANAEPPARAVAHEVVGHVDAGGLAEAITRALADGDPA